MTFVNGGSWIGGKQFRKGFNITKLVEDHVVQMTDRFEFVSRRVKTGELEWEYLMIWKEEREQT
jgi:hypothetical protein